MFVLPVQLHESDGQVSKCSCRHQSAVDECPASTLRRDFASDDQLALVGLEDRFDGGGSLPGANQISRCARAEEQADRLDEDRLAGTSLAGQHVEAAVELDLDRLDDCEIADTEKEEHAGGTSIESDV